MGVSSWRYCLHIAYYGTGFVGWQRQQKTQSMSGLISVQELVEDAVTKILGAAHRVNVTGQFGFIRLNTELHMTLGELKDRVNAKLEKDRVVVLGVIVPSMGPTRIRSHCKKYIYYLQQGHRPDLELGKYSWFLGRKIDIQRIREALEFIKGTHDFRPFSQGLRKLQFGNMTTVRTILSAKVVVRRNVNFSLDPKVCGNGEIFDAGNVCCHTKSARDMNDCLCDGQLEATVANGFLRHMVRRIIGTLRPIGEGTLLPSRMQKVLAGEVQSGPSAPTKALWLHRTWLTQAEYDADRAEEEK